METITTMLDSLKSGAYDDITNDELYDLILEKRYNVLFPNCLLHSLRAAGAPFRVEKGGKGLFTSTGLNKSLLPLRPFTHQSGFHYNLRLSFLNLVSVLNGAYTYQGRDTYDIDRNELARAFRLLLATLNGLRRSIPPIHGDGSRRKTSRSQARSAS